MACRFKTIFALCLFFIFLALPPFSFAEDDVRVITPVLKQSTGAAEATTASSALNKKVDTLIERIKAAVERVTNIAERISKRLSKVQKGNSKAKKLSTQNINIGKQVEKLKKELKKTEDLSSKLLKSPNPKKEYQLFQRQVINIDTLLKDVFNTEKNLLNSMEQFVSPTAVSTVTAVPKR